MLGSLGVPDAVEVGVVVVVVTAAQVLLVMVLVSRVTAPFLANNLPSMTAPVVAVTEVRAKTLPRKVELVPSVAEDPTCQKMLQDRALPVRTILLDEAVMRVEAAWKIKTAFGSP